jgi:UPF0716 protein FxsA
MRFIFVLFIILPIAEFMLLMEVGSRIGALRTIAIVLLAAYVGVQIIKRQGFATLIRAQQRMQSGELPTAELLEGFMLAIGGILFLIPGFITDIAGVVFLIPFSRRPLAAYLLRAGMLQTLGNGVGGTFTSYKMGQHGSHTGQACKTFYEGEFVREASPIEALTQTTPIDASKQASKSQANT